MKLKSKILSAILALTMITSVLPMSSLVANAGSSSTGLSGRNLGASGYYLLNANKAVIKINASVITDDTTEAHMANANYKYGNGSNTDMLEYPLMMQSRIRNYTDIGSPSISHDTQYISEGSNWSNDTLRNSMREEYQKWLNAIHSSNGAWSGNIDNRRKWIYEYVNDDGNEGHLYINTPNSFNATDKNGRVVQYQSPSVFLEDTLSKVIRLTDDGVISTKDAACFWKFYTSIAVGANADVDAWYDGNRGVSEQPGYKLNELLKSIKNNTNEKDRFMRGYIVALYATYGNSAVRALTGNDFSKSGRNDWGNGNAWGVYKSLVVSKLESVPTGTNRVPGHPEIKEMLMATDGWLAFLKSMDQLSGRSSNTLYDYVNWGTMNRNENNFSNYIYHYADIVRPAISPHRVRNNAASLSSTSFSGWGYYEFTGGTSTRPIPKTDVDKSDKFTVGTQATYSAYLISKEERDTLNSTGTITRAAMQDQSDKFGDNGCVMSDLIYVSQPKEVTLSGRNSIPTSGNIYTTDFDKKIKLDSPAANTEFSLTKLSYYISNANGGASTYVQGTNSGTYKKFSNNGKQTYNYKEKEYGNIKTDAYLKSANPYLEIPASDIRSALNNDAMAAKYRASKIINDEGIAEGYWSEDGTTKHYYYVFQRDNSAASGYSKKQLNGHNMTTRKADLGNTNYGTYSSTDINEQSSNLYYLYLDNEYKPFYYRGGEWYYAPVERTTSILITMRGDYTACYADSSSTVYKDMFKTANNEVPVMPEYLLAKNYSTDNMRKKTLYAQIDDYLTGMTGSLANRNYDYYTETGNGGAGGNISLPGTSVTYNSRSLTDAGGTFRTGDELKLSKSNGVISNLDRKLGYVNSLTKTIPLFINATTPAQMNMTFANYNMPALITRFNNRNNRLVEVDRHGNTVTEYANQYRLGYTGGNTISELTAYRGEKSPTSTSNTALNPELTYSKSSFRKILASYQTYAYTLKADISTNAVPYYAGWLNTANNSNSIKLGLTGGTTSKTLTGVTSTYFGFIRFGETGRFNSAGEGHMRRLENNKGLPWSIAKVVTKSFNTNLAANKTFRVATTAVENSYDIPLRTGLNVHDTKDISMKNVGATYIKQSNGSIALSYQYGTTSVNNGIYKNGSKVFLGVYPEVKMWAENDLSKTSGNLTHTAVKTSGTKVRYIPAMTYTTATFDDVNADVQVTGLAIAYDTRAKKLATQLGTADTQVLYSGTAINGTSVVKASGKVTSYAFAFQGVGTEGGTLNGVEIKNAWGNSNYSSVDAAAAGMKNLLDNYSVSQSNSIGIYNGSNSSNGYTEFNVKSRLSNGTLSADSTSLNRDVIYYQVFIEGGRVTSVEAKAYSAVNGRGAESLANFTVNGTNVTCTAKKGSDSIEILHDSNAQTEARAFVSKTNTTLANDVKVMLTHMKLIGDNNIIEKTFEWGTGVKLPAGLTSSAAAVDHLYSGTKYSDTSKRANQMSYSEDCSVLQIRSYTANIKSTNANSTFTEQIPINLGPETPTDKNKYFSSGYSGFVNTIAKVIVKNDIACTDGSTVAAGTEVKAVRSKHNPKNGTGEVTVNSSSTAVLALPDFIIGDVPISEALSG